MCALVLTAEVEALEAADDVTNVSVLSGDAGIVARQHCCENHQRWRDVLGEGCLRTEVTLRNRIRPPKWRR